MESTVRLALHEAVLTPRGEPGVVVAVIHQDEYSSSELRHRFAPLVRGVLIRMSDGELRHFRDAPANLRRA